MQRLLGGCCQPIAVGLIGFDDDVGLVLGEIGTAEHGVPQPESPFFGWRQAVGNDAAGDDVLLQAEGRNEKTVQHVFRDQAEIDPLINRQMQL